MRIFLSGAVENVKDLGTGWRINATENLEDLGYEVVTPIVSSEKRVLWGTNEIVDRNFYLQKSCDLLLVEMATPRHNYIGTMYELVKAKELSQPTIVWSDLSYQDRVYLKYLSTVILPTLHDCIEYIATFYSSRKVA